MADRSIPRTSNWSNGRRGIGPDERRQIATRFEGGLSTGKIAAEHGICRESVRNIAIEYGVYDNTRRKGFAINAQAFSAITPESAYWIGFLMADGAIVDRSIVLQLAAKDRDHVEKFRAFVGSSHMISDIPAKPPGTRTTPCGPGSRISFVCEPMRQRLAEFGIVVRKSGGEFITELENDRDFWRGMVDGDGMLGIYKRGTTPGRYFYDGKWYPRVFLCGGRQIVEQFRAYLARNISSRIPEIRPNGSIFGVYLGDRASYEATVILYRDCMISLDRKKAIADRVMSEFSHLLTDHKIKAD